MTMTMSLSLHGLWSCLRVRRPSHVSVTATKPREQQSIIQGLLVVLHEPQAPHTLAHSPLGRSVAHSQCMRAAGEKRLRHWGGISGGGIDGAARRTTAGCASIVEHLDVVATVRPVSGQRVARAHAWQLSRSSCTRGSSYAPQVCGLRVASSWGLGAGVLASSLGLAHVEDRLRSPCFAFSFSRRRVLEYVTCTRHKVLAYVVFLPRTPKSKAKTCRTVHEGQDGLGSRDGARRQCCRPKAAARSGGVIPDMPLFDESIDPHVITHENPLGCTDQGGSGPGGADAEKVLAHDRRASHLTRCWGARGRPLTHALGHTAARVQENPDARRPLRVVPGPIQRRRGVLSCVRRAVYLLAAALPAKK